MATTTKTSLLSGALVRIGQGPISDTTGTSDEKVAAEVVYDTVKEAMLAEHPWAFALRESVEAQLAGGGAGYNTQYAFVYQMPAKAVAFIGLTSLRKFELYGDQIHTDDDSGSMIFIENVGEAFFRPYFSLAMIYQLASELAISITDSTSMAEKWEKKAEKQWQKARSRNAMETVNPLFENALDQSVYRNTSARP